MYAKSPIIVKSRFDWLKVALHSGTNFLCMRMCFQLCHVRWYTYTLIYYSYFITYMFQIDLLCHQQYCPNLYQWNHHDLTLNARDRTPSYASSRALRVRLDEHNAQEILIAVKEKANKLDQFLNNIYHYAKTLHKHSKK